MFNGSPATRVPPGLVVLTFMPIPSESGRRQSKRMPPRRRKLCIASHCLAPKIAIALRAHETSMAAERIDEWSREDVDLEFQQSRIGDLGVADRQLVMDKWARYVDLLVYSRSP